MDSADLFDMQFLKFSFHFPISENTYGKPTAFLCLPSSPTIAPSAFYMQQ